MINYVFMKKSFPIHGVIGILLLLLSGFLNYKKIDPIHNWFYCFAWWSYILTVDAFVYWIRGSSLILNRTREFFLMIPWSVFIWLIFEAANLALQNWYYINLPRFTGERWLGYAVAFGTVLPGIFETAELLESLALFRGSKTKKRMVISSAGHSALTLLGVFCLASSVIIPEFLFPLIWVGFIFLLEPFNYRSGGKSLLKDLKEGDPRKIYLLLVAGLICGLLWEFWNYGSHSKWVYTVPFFEKTKGFEMPFLGFLGFPPFAVQVYVMYNFISLFRFRRLTLFLTTVLMMSFFILIFMAMDLKTVDSYEVRLSEAYWIDSKHRENLPKVGISTLDDLLSKTKDKKERDEMALRLLIPREELIQWVEKSRLVQLKGLGMENLRILEEVGIHSVQQLSLEDPERLYEKIEQQYPGRSVPRKAKIRIWIREAQKKVTAERRAHSA